MSATDGRRRLESLARKACRDGWTVTRTGSGHLRWRSPAGGVVITASTPGDGRAFINALTQLRRAGLHTS